MLVIILILGVDFENSVIYREDNKREMKWIKNYSNDNYNLVYSDTIDNYQTTFCGTAFAFLYFTYHWFEERSYPHRNQNETARKIFLL